MATSLNHFYNMESLTAEFSKLPKEKNKLALWLLGFHEENQAESMEAYQKLVDESRQDYNEQMYERKDVKGEDSFALTYYNHRYDRGYSCVAGWVSKDITHEEMKTLLSGKRFPHPYYIIAETMRRLGFTEQEIKEVYNS